ncbi:hypothetical protein [Mucilaginibacter pineti]|uniref:hypothetical protein n=1 Tax=Mucilaginibacter pineti TaxID=1391627 RepID=UPI0013BE958E|nr:hypothetical protein [Mucilaginibacter pineti]
MKATKNRTIKIKKENEQWKLYALFSRLTVSLDRLPDAGQVQRNPLRSAPPELTEMVF